MLENYLIEICIILVLLVILYFFVGWFCRCNTNEKMLCTYGYSDSDGPNTWKYRFQIRGENQSPINILSVCAVVVPTETIAPLDFTSEYHITPQEMKLLNDGYTVVIYSTWSNGRKPTVCGGPLCDEYKLFSIRFRWGPNDEEGSEHMIDMRRYAMELQVTYNKCSCKCTDMAKSIKTCAVIIISYMFEVTDVDNPYLETIIQGLRHIQNPCCSYYIRPVPVSLLAPVFTRRYFSYIGSLTYPPCTEGVRWIIQPEPLAISSHQIRQFRRLMGFNGYILNNTRPVQNANNRDVIFYE
ncbi:carbonic anhydrase 1 isoform X1 [Tribolium castaneum]|uniref:Carbonic anhydrase 2-like Protein n=2 Tax=Tribolium castaneum TaxID=7070 RepID=D6W9D0_TRICA|nr:PREDICTED: carbonic anhydrase 1 [Tribolium castaneum]EEZ98483.1 Carbonic anhydrase 2-like Protein [Tribolium castaneum]|eukprot:XP_969962.1 PREDICTED: carbonic anhydrase 1 [Tribolium castaneum]